MLTFSMYQVGDTNTVANQYYITPNTDSDKTVTRYIYLINYLLHTIFQPDDTITARFQFGLHP